MRLRSANSETLRAREVHLSDLMQGWPRLPPVNGTGKGCGRGHLLVASSRLPTGHPTHRCRTRTQNRFFHPSRVPARRPRAPHWLIEPENGETAPTCAANRSRRWAACGPRRSKGHTTMPSTHYLPSLVDRAAVCSGRSCPSLVRNRQWDIVDKCPLPRDVYDSDLD